MLTEVRSNERFGRVLDVLRLGPCAGVLLRTLNNSYPLFKLRLYHFPSVRTVIILCFWQFEDSPARLSAQGDVLQMSAQCHEKSSHDRVSRRKIWIRSAGKCECISSCEHHEAGRCGIALLPEFWAVRDILPAWAGGGHHIGVSMFEALCEACRLSPGIEDRLRET